MALDSRIPLMVLPLLAAICLLSLHLSLHGDQAAMRWWVQAEVEAGAAAQGEPEVLGGKNFILSQICTPRQMWRSVATHFMILVGWFHRPAATRLTTVFDVFSLLEPTDPEGRFCRQVLDYCWRWVGGSFACESPQIRATSPDILNFIRACRQAHTHLSEEERTLLEPYRTSGIIPMALLRRSPDNSSLDVQQAKGPVNLPRNVTEGKRLSREGLIKVLNESLRSSALSGVVPSPPEAVVKIFSTFNLLEVPVIRSDWAEVGHAIRESQIVRFDSTPLLPRELFNMSMEQLAHNEGPAAERIPVFPQLCAPLSLSSYAAFAQSHVQSGKRSGFSLAHWQNFGLEPPPEVPPSVTTYIRKSSLEANNASSCQDVNVNARRLPNLFSRIPHRLEEALGLEEEILRMQPYLWLGPVENNVHHHDEDDNIYIQLSGHSDVFLFPQSQTDFWGAHFGNSKTLTFNDPLLRMVPLFLVHLRPGDGLLFPGRSYHKFCGQSSDRIALNIFLQPRWRKMQFSKDGWYAREAGKELGLEHLALRQLYMRTITHLYEETGKGIIYQHRKNEFL